MYIWIELVNRNNALVRLDWRAGRKTDIGGGWSGWSGSACYIHYWITASIISSRNRPVNH